MTFFNDGLFHSVRFIINLIMVEAKGKAEAPVKISINTEAFIHENTGNIKDFYKISSCIGRGK